MSPTFASFRWYRVRSRPSRPARYAGVSSVEALSTMQSSNGRVVDARLSRQARVMATRLWTTITTLTVTSVAAMDADRGRAARAAQPRAAVDSRREPGRAGAPGALPDRRAVARGGRDPRGGEDRPDPGGKHLRSPLGHASVRGRGARAARRAA